MLSARMVGVDFRISAGSSGPGFGAARGPIAIKDGDAT
ncbi:Hypothetical protein A7982_02983 [Minicystis rosea]|nr:Hypothetical protein A7982_02983 [Minicystis rosea]